MTLHRITAAAFVVLLILSGIGTIMARQAAPDAIDSVELTDDPAETPLAVGGQAEAVLPADDGFATPPDLVESAPPAEPATEGAEIGEAPADPAEPLDVSAESSGNEADEGDDEDEDDGDD